MFSFALALLMIPAMADPRVRQGVSRLGLATRYHPEEADERRRELQQIKLELAAQEYADQWPAAWPALINRLSGIPRGADGCRRDRETGGERTDG